jgi:hypothetical protein
MRHGLVLAALVLASCSVPDIDRTQPNKVLKTTFKKADGSPKEFWYRQTVIDLPATNGISFIGEQGDTDRVVFDITEDYLYAYRSYAHLAADDGSGDDYVRPGTGPFQGAPVAAFRITSHFDVKRQYNPATGEQTNVIVEDGSDRPWYDRDYIRVDWSQNLVADFRFGVAAVTQQPLADAVPQEDPTHDDAKEKAIVTPEYIDVVTRYTAEPEHLYFQGYGNLPVCYFYMWMQKDCMGGVVKVRSSFREVEASDYVPLAYDDVRFQKFGFFRTERYRFNDQYGVVEPAQVHLANRWNIWQRGADCYQPEADRPYATCTPDQLKTIVYYLNEDFPRTQEMVEMARQNADAWNDLWREAVKSMTGWSDDQLGDKRVFRLCVNNPVQSGDPEECGAPGTNPQIGDLRYSMYYYVPNVSDASPLGYGPSAADPLTGEIIQANAFYYGSAGGFIAARTRDIVKLELGLFENGVADIRDGLPAREAIRNLRARADARLEARGLAFDPQRVQSLADELDVAAKGDRLRFQLENGEAYVDKRAGRLQALESSSIDEDLLTDEVKQAMQYLTRAPDGSQQLLEPTSVAFMVDPDFMVEMNRQREARLLTPAARGCILMAEDVFDDGLLGLVGLVKQKFYDTTTNPPSLKPGFTDEDVYAWIEARTMGDTQLHEVGHTMGLRHNFAGTADPLNYEPAFWELKGTTMTAAEERPRPEWELQGASLSAHRTALEDGLRDAQNSTVMDYASTYGTNVVLGSYDLAAIKYAYGDMVEVFDSPDVTPERAALLQTGALHYTYYPEVVSDAPTFEERAAAIYDRSDVNFRRTKADEDSFDASLVEAPYLFCSDEYNHASATCSTWDQGADNFERTTKLAEDYRNYYVFDAFKRERLTFGVYIYDYLNRVYTRKMSPMLDQYKNWVNDEFIIRADEPCKVVQDGQIVETGERFAAGGCGLAGFLGTVELMNLFAELLQSPDVGCYVRLKPGCYDVPATSTDGIEPDTKLVSADPAACDAYVPVQPDPDSRDPQRAAFKVEPTTAYKHVRDSTTCDGWEPLVDTATGETISEEQIELALGGARPANTLYDRERYGYYFYNKPVVIGSWWEKWLAVKAMGDGNTDFIGVDASSDTRSFYISLNLLFGESINNLVGAVATERADVYAPRLNQDGDDVEFLPLLDVATGGSYDRSSNTRPLLDPDQQYTFRLLAMFNAAYNGQNTDDFEFGNSLRLGAAYNTTDITVADEVRADPAKYAEVTDPNTGLKWYALRQKPGDDQLYSVAFQHIRNMKAKYYVGGADGPGTDLRPEFAGNASYLVDADVRMLNQMSATANAFGYSSVWTGDIDF